MRKTDPSLHLLPTGFNDLTFAQLIGPFAPGYQSSLNAFISNLVAPLLADEEIGPPRASAFTRTCIEIGDVLTMAKKHAADFFGDSPIPIAIPAALIALRLGYRHDQIDIYKGQLAFDARNAMIGLQAFHLRRSAVADEQKLYDPVREGMNETDMFLCMMEINMHLRLHIRDMRAHPDIYLNFNPFAPHPHIADAVYTYDLGRSCKWPDCSLKRENDQCLRMIEKLSDGQKLEARAECLYGRP